MVMKVSIEVRWATFAEAAATLSYERDRGVLASLPKDIRKG